MKAIEVHAGDVICIPCDIGFGMAKVLFRSNVHIDIVLLGLYRLAVGSALMPSSLPHDFARVVFTSCQRIKKNVWPKVGSVAVSEAERSMTQYQIQGEVFIGDEFLGMASPEQRKTLPRLTVWNTAYVQEQINKICAELR